MRCFRRVTLLGGTISVSNACRIPKLADARVEGSTLVVEVGTKDAEGTDYPCFALPTVQYIDYRAGFITTKPIDDVEVVHQGGEEFTKIEKCGFR